MKIWHFSEMAYHPGWETLGDSLRNVIPSEVYDPELGADLYHRYLEEGPGRLMVVFRGTGAAIFFTSLTTIIGFSGMMFVDHPGLASLGNISVIGIFLCLVASVVFVPAVLRLGEWLFNKQNQ